MMAGTLNGLAPSRAWAASVVNMLLLLALSALAVLDSSGTYARAGAAFTGVWFCIYGWSWADSGERFTVASNMLVGTACLISGLAPQLVYAFLDGCIGFLGWFFFAPR